MTAKRKMKITAGDLVNVWIEVEQAKGSSITEALNGLNAATGRKYTLSRLSEWRKGSDKQRPDDAAKRYMMERVMIPVLTAAGCRKPKTENALHALLDRLTVLTTHEGP